MSLSHFIEIIKIEYFEVYNYLNEKENKRICDIKSFE
jgi:hypothetical protein